MRKIVNEQSFLEGAGKTLTAILSSFRELPTLRRSDFDKADTAVVSIDIVKGFCEFGSLSSHRVAELVPHAVALLALFEDCEKVFFIDRHDEDSAEFGAYPPHCVKGSHEDELVDALKPFLAYKATICPKNSVNGLFAPAFQTWLRAHSDIKKFIVTGDVTDICVDSFAKSLKAYFNQENLPVRVIVPVDCVETFDLDATHHNADLMNLMTIYGLRANGIEIVEKFV